MRILNVGHYFHVRGGSDRYMIELGRLLESRSHRVIPFATSSARNDPTEFESFFPEGVDTNRLRPVDGLRFLWSRPSVRALDRLLSDHDVDIAHLHIYYGHLTTSILAPLRERGIPIVQTLHEYKLTCPVYTHLRHGKVCEACGGKAFWKAARHRCNGGSVLRSMASSLEALVSRLGGDAELDHYIAPSDFLRRKMLEHEVVHANRISTVHNFVDPAAFTPSRSGGTYFLYFGRIDSEKGIETLIRASQTIRDVPLKVVGGGPLEDVLARSCERQGLDHIEFLGFQTGDDLRNLIKGSLCAIVPSEWFENCPMSILETFALGRPVIGADIGGIPELVIEGETGNLFRSGDADDLARAMQRLARNPSIANRMGRTARARTEGRFSPKRHYEALLQVYRKVLRCSWTTLEGSDFTDDR